MAKPRWPQDEELRGTTHPVEREPTAATHQSCPKNSMAVMGSFGPDTPWPWSPGREASLGEAWVPSGQPGSPGDGDGEHGPARAVPWSQAGEAREAAAPCDSAQRCSLPREGTTNIENERAAADGRKWTGVECGAVAVGAPEAGPSPQQPGPRRGRTRCGSGARGPLCGTTRCSRADGQDEREDFLGHVIPALTQGRGSGSSQTGQGALLPRPTWGKGSTENPGSTVLPVPCLC